METYYIEPTSSKSLLIAVIILVFIFLALILMAFNIYSLSRSRVELSEDSLRLVGGYWGREFSIEELMVSEARIVDIDSSADTRLGRRIGGSAVAGYRAGWFKLGSGEKALLYVTNRSKVVYIPTLRNHVLMLSVRDPDKFIKSLNNYSSRR